MSSLLSSIPYSILTLPTYDQNSTLLIAFPRVYVNDNMNNEYDSQHDHNVSLGHGHDERSELLIMLLNLARKQKKLTPTDDFFELVPPTPFDSAHGPLHQNPNLGEHENLQAHHLRPTPFRNHRSSSTGSISSQISAFSGSTNLTQWGSDTDHSDLNQSSFPGLSIDPKLFQAKPKTPTLEPERIEVLTGSTRAATAGLASKGKKRARATTQKEKDEKKKISHARKVCRVSLEIDKPD